MRTLTGLLFTAGLILLTGSCTAKYNSNATNIVSIPKSPSRFVQIANHIKNDPSVRIERSKTSGKGSNSGRTYATNEYTMKLGEGVEAIYFDVSKKSCEEGFGLSEKIECVNSEEMYESIDGRVSSSDTIEVRGKDAKIVINTVPGSLSSIQSMCEPMGFGAKSIMYILKTGPSKTKYEKGIDKECAYIRTIIKDKFGSQL